MNSLRVRLLLGAVLGVSAALAVAGIFLVTVFGAHVHRRYVKELDDHLLQLAAAIQIDQAGAITLKHDLSDPAFQRPLSGLYWQVADAGRVVLRSRSLWDSPLTLGAASAKPGELQEGEIPGPGKQRLIAVERRVLLQSNDERPLQLAVAGDRHVIDEARGDFAKVVTLSLAILAALLAAASWLQVNAGLAPLQALRQHLNRLRQGRAARLEGTYPDELSGLVGDLNGLLATQAREVERARSNAAKLGHGLKTPLAVLAAESRALHDKGDHGAAEAIEHEIEAMNAQVGRALAAVRAVGQRKAAGTRTALEPLLQRLIDVMKRLPRGDTIEWSLSAAPPGIDVAIDHRDLEDLFGNLLDNARKWAKSRVLVSVGTADQAAQIVVEDDGPGIPKERAEEAVTHGTRLDWTGPGTGIGLAIVQDLVALHGGTFELRQAASNGVRAAVRLPPDHSHLAAAMGAHPVEDAVEAAVNDRTPPTS
jgi:signal transduction histidine kinase